MGSVHCVLHHSRRWQGIQARLSHWAAASSPRGLVLSPPLSLSISSGGQKFSLFFFWQRGRLPRKSSSGGMQSCGRRREDVPGGPDSGGVHTLADKEAPIIPVYECVSHSAVLEAMTRGSRQGFFLIPRSPGGNAFFLFFLFFFKKKGQLNFSLGAEENFQSAEKEALANK